ncbi:M13 family metallopeptidase [Ideonella sp. BN130291]|uniref:M13 family metallopeptidase n=1 Tax=Ideonella sp. BN130291 TaxID=3112940 RepID=UPI002E265F13|nr:M13 family metallopeptidase [Ideonella sp. BN130291]
MTLQRSLLAGVAALALVSVAFAAPPVSGIDKAALDPSVRPQDDLFQAANGTWLKKTEIPADKADWGITREMRDRSDARVRQIVEDLAKAKHAPGSIEQKIGDYYAAFIDEAAIDKAGLAPVKPWLAEIDAAATPAELARLMGRLQGVSSTAIELAVYPDPKEPGIYRALTWQDGLGLPDRDYYLKDDERFAKARAAYKVYLETLFAQIGDKAAAEHAKSVYAIEQRLAEAQWPRVDNRNPVKRYNPMTPAELAAKAPGFDWAAYFTGAGLPPLDRLSVSQPSYAIAFAKLVADTPLPELKLYLRARLLDDAAEVLPKPFRDARFAFRDQALKGLQQPLPRWQQATTALGQALGEGVGQIYVQRHFPPAYKARMQQLVGKLFEAYAQSIDGLAWMSPQTKLRAKDKLAKYSVKIGYPDVWRDYTKLEVKPGDAFGNGVRAGRFEFERRAARAGKPVDRREWGMTPQTVNAYYNPSFNEIVFPAAILEPPYFDMAADDAFNFGAIGATIGHEISHGFDDSGSQYNGDGVLDNWWTEADRKAFDALGARLAKQFDAYEPVPGHHVNGKLTLGENIADLSGLEIALKAYHLSLGGKPAPVIDGLTGDQRFFMGYAQSWRDKIREERLVQLITSDPHAPPQTRTNGPVVNIDAFHQSFGTQPKDGMWKPAEQRIHIW